MRVVFRVDASLDMGTGHVMRCLTLARALREQGHACLFICREHAGNFNALIGNEGFVVHRLPLSQEQNDELAHAHWLGGSQAEDAGACKALIAEWKPDWLVVDHYALDHRWEAAVTPAGCRLLAIDDLADRRHSCDLLLDQTFGRTAEAYQSKVLPNCQLLCGSQYALLRPEFSALRNYSLQRRSTPRLQRILVSMGGVDKDNATEQALDALRTCPLPEDCQITVVMGGSAPWLSAVKDRSRHMPRPTEVLVGVSNMAKLMADSDLAIGAAGATVWERSCLGLPTVMMVLADNQKYAAQMLEEVGAARVVTLGENLSTELKNEIIKINNSAVHLSRLSDSASSIVDGLGCQRLIERMIS